MADVSGIITKVVDNLVTLIKGLVIFFVFAGILWNYPYDINPIGGIIDLVESFLDGGLAGLLALLVFVWFLGNKKD
ncbi:MAG: hypothetical protein IIB44_11845 [Candidatus Marinimicrobia bacterium]|nr:hypothetical protein [Candidatus Neomarinimicrobiota bacterium]MCH8068191.1 hypothetical protein [Candidatus Neomarinimicrobiota bacterium]